MLVYGTSNFGLHKHCSSSCINVQKLGNTQPPVLAYKTTSSGMQLQALIYTTVISSIQYITKSSNIWNHTLLSSEIQNHQPWYKKTHNYQLWCWFSSTEWSCGKNNSDCLFCIATLACSIKVGSITLLPFSCLSNIQNVSVNVAYVQLFFHKLSCTW